MWEYCEESKASFSPPNYEEVPVSLELLLKHTGCEEDIKLVLTQKCLWWVTGQVGLHMQTKFSFSILFWSKIISYIKKKKCLHFDLTIPVFPDWCCILDMLLLIISNAPNSFLTQNLTHTESSCDCAHFLKLFFWGSGLSGKKNNYLCSTQFKKEENLGFITNFYQAHSV